MDTSDPRALLDALNQLESLRNLRKPAGSRHFKRHVVRGEAELHALDQSRLDHVPLPIQLRDVGLGGLGFVCQRELPVGSMWRVCFYSHGYLIAQQAGLVRHVRAVRDGVYLAGLQFCAEAGLLHLLGVEPTDALALDPGGDEEFAFLPPAEVA